MIQRSCGRGETPRAGARPARTFVSRFLARLAIVVACLVGAAPPGAANETNDEFRCLALNVYWEARSQNRETRLAVAYVTLNRLQSPDYPDTICGVVTQGGERPLGRCQFSWWCDGRSDRPADPDAWAEAQDSAWRALSGEVADPTGGALFFHDGRVAPDWLATRTWLGQIGDLYFYR